MINKIVKIIVLVALFVTPLFYLPFTQDPFGFNKEMFLTIAMLIVAGLWFAHAVRSRRLTIIQSPLNSAMLIILAIYLIASITSVEWFTSVFNLQGSGLPSLVVMFGLVLLYFIVVNVFSGKVLGGGGEPITVSKDGLSKPHRAIISGALGGETGEFTQRISLLFLVLLLAFFATQVLSWLGWFGFFILPGGVNSLTSLGAHSELAAVTALGFPIALYFILRGRNIVYVILGGLYILGALFTLNTINFSSGWILTAVGSFFLLALVTAFYHQLKIHVGRTWIIASVLVLSLLFVLVRPSSLVSLFFPTQYQPAIPAEVSLSGSASRGIAIRSTLRDPLGFILGKGPGNFVYSFSEARPAVFNNNPLWQVRFNVAGNVFYEMIATIGWLGFLSFLLLLGAIGALLLKQIRSPQKEIDGESRFVVFTLFSVFGTVVASMFLQVPGIVTWMLLFLTAAITVIIDSVRRKQAVPLLHFDLRQSTHSALFFSFGLVLVAVLFLFFVVYTAQLYMGEYYFAQSRKALATAQDGSGVEEARQLTAQAVRFNQNASEYYLNIARLSLIQAQVALNAATDTEPVDAVLIQRLLADAANSSNIALGLRADDVTVWESRGTIFEIISPFAAQAREFAIDSFTRAAELEPTNPVLYYRMGENQRLLWQEQQNAATPSDDDVAGPSESGTFNLTLIDEASANLQRAVELKADYLAPRVSLARIAEAQGNVSDAIGHIRASLQLATQVNDQLNLSFELSRLVYNKVAADDFANEQEVQGLGALLNSVIAAFPDNSNSLYIRSLVLSELGDSEGALADMERVGELNPDNPDVQSKLEALREQGSYTVPYIGEAALPEEAVEEGEDE